MPITKPEFIHRAERKAKSIKAAFAALSECLLTPAGVEQLVYLAKEGPQATKRRMKRRIQRELHKYRPTRAIESNSGDNAMNTFLIRYEIGHELGSGSAGTVYRARRRINDEVRVVKLVEDKLDSLTEVKLLKRIKHQRIVNMYEHFTTWKREAIILEYCDVGDLGYLCNTYWKQQLEFPVSFLWHVFQSIAEGLAYLHGEERWPVSGRPVYPHQIVHRDLKPENIMLSWRRGANMQREYPQVKIGDFGLAGHTGSIFFSKEWEFGTACYQPPERPLATSKGDVWALGAIVHVLTNGEAPMKAPEGWDPADKNGPTWEQDPKNICVRARPLEHTVYSEARALEQCMLECLTLDVEKRPTALTMVKRLKQRNDSKFMPLIEECCRTRVNQSHLGRRWLSDSREVQLGREKRFVTIIGGYYSEGNGHAV